MLLRGTRVWGKEHLAVPGSLNTQTSLPPAHISDVDGLRKASGRFIHTGY
jgi:hypothetical protein